MDDDSDTTDAEFSEALAGLRARATGYDLSGDWPAEDLAALAAAGAGRWAVPAAFGGADLDPLALHLRYEQIAAASASAALIVSQRDSAVGLIDSAQVPGPRAELLPKLARDEWFATVGIAQLTTSRQGGRPALRAAPEGDGYRLDGIIPWSTGAARSRFVVAGAAVEEWGRADGAAPAPRGGQILFALPADLPGVRVGPPLPLVALRSTWTAAVELRDVRLDRRWLLRGPEENVLAARRKSLPAGQAFLATGLCRGAIDLLAAHDSGRARSAAAAFEGRLARLRGELLALSRPGGSGGAAAAPRLRGAINDFALRVTHAAVALYKGSALLSEHPAQRLAREALFLLVWSCPDPVIDCTVETLYGTGEAIR